MVTITYADRKGEPGKMTLNHTPTFAPAAALTFLQAKSYAGFQKYSTIVATDFTTPLAAGTDELVNNDKDFKAVLGFEGAEGRFKIEIPCPKVNIEGGFVVRWGQNRAFIPPTKAVGETGDDGAALQTSLRGMTGDNTILFKYGRIKKAI
jgi:hypothetical protein